MKRAIITGATGAIGSALIKKLVEFGIEVLVLCRKDSSRKENIINHKLVKIIYCSLDEFCNIKNEFGVDYDVFYHFAWSGTYGKDREDMYTQNNNVRYALDAVLLAKKFGCKLFIGAGSQAEYGRFSGSLKPNTPTFPENGYGYAKLCAGQMTRGLAHQLGLKHIWTRILSVFGPNDGAQSMVMSTILKLIKGEIPIFTKGEQIWDYLFSEDAANAFFLLGIKGIDGKIYVIGSGCTKPLKEYIITIRDIVNPYIPLRFGEIPYNSHQVMHLSADISELKKDTGFEPVTKFEEGISRIVYDLKNKVL